MTRDEESVFAQALGLEDPRERADYLDRACAGDLDLRKNVESLLAAYQAGQFLESPACALNDTAEETRCKSPDTVIGPYRLLQQLGEGGFGVVYFAEQTEPVRRRVALKVLKAGMDTRQVVARFEAERQALALMDHPNIARIFEGGATDSGRPYFVMELVKGVSITQFCDEHRLPIRQRLALFLDVCQAVQHAHLKGIIHRDIKPSNALVAAQDGNPVVKVIDFGIAKAMGQQLTDKTLCTGSGQMIGTPLYMSPEQAGMGGLDIDTRTDIYSLGVLLYELLIGTTPFDANQLRRAGYDEIRRIIREEDPARPSTRAGTLGDGATVVSANRQSDPKRLSQVLRGELDWIVMKCLEKDRDRRYETVNALARDVERYLADEPVQACPPSVHYQLRKFVRRNRRALTTAGIILLAIVLAGGALGWAILDRQAGRIAAEMEKSRQEDDKDREAGLALTEAEELRDRRDWPRALAKAQRAEWLLAEGGSETNRQRVQEILADLQMVSQLEETRLSPTLGVPLLGFSPEFQAIRYRGVAKKYTAVFKERGIDVAALDVPTAAERIRSKPAAVREQVLGALDDWLWSILCDIRPLKELRGVFSADPVKHARDLKELDANLKVEAEEYDHIRAVADLVGPNESSRRIRDPQVQKDKQALEELAGAGKAGGLAPATAIFLARLLAVAGMREKAVETLSAVQQGSPDDLLMNYELALFLSMVGPARREEAISFMRAAVALRPENPGLHLALGNLLQGAGRPDQAIAAYRKAIEVKSSYARAYRALVKILEEAGNFDEALAVHAKYVAVFPTESEGYVKLAHAYCRARQWDKAIATLRDGIRLSVRAGSDLEAELAWLLATCPNPDLRDATEAVRHAEAARQKQPNLARPWDVLGAARYRAGDWEGAITALEQANQLPHPIPHSRTGVLFFLAMAYWQHGDPEQARQEYDRAVFSIKYLEGSHEKNPEAFPWIKEAREELDRFRAEAARLFHIDLTGKPLVEEAIADYRDAIRKKPDDGVAHKYLAAALRDRKELDEAIVEYRETIRLRPEDALARRDLAGVLRDKGRLDDAITEYQKAVGRYEQLVAKSPRALDLYGLASSLNELALILRERGQLAEARKLLEQAIDRHKAAFEVTPKGMPINQWALRGRYLDLAETLVRLKEHGAAVSAAEEMPRISPQPKVFWDAAEFLARCVPLAEKDTNLPEAERQGLSRKYADRAMELLQKSDADHLASSALDPLRSRPDFKKLLAEVESRRPPPPVTGAQKHYTQGLMLRTTKKLTEAAAAFQQAVALEPNHAEAYWYLGLVLRDQGKFADAYAALKKGQELGSKRPSWSVPLPQALADCERLAPLDARLPAVLEGKDKLKDAREHWDFARLCTRKEMHASAARFYQEGLKAKPESNGLWEPAARAAALAGSGKGDEAAGLDDKERARWRKQALGWLQATLTQRRRALEKETPQVRESVQRTLELWKDDRDLAGVRDPAALAKLSEEERQAWEKFWSEVETLLQRVRKDKP